MPNVLMNPYMLQAMGAMQQMPTGQQAYGRQMRGLGQQFGLAQRRATMQAGQLNIPPHLQFAIGQQQLPGMYGQYAGALGAASGQAGQLDVQRAATMGQFGLGAARVSLEQQRLDMMRRQMRPNFWNILGTVAGIGTSIAGLAMGNPMSAANIARMQGQFQNYQQGMTPVPQINMPQFQPQQPMVPGMGGGGAGSMGIPMGQAMNWMYPPVFQQAGYGGY